MARKARDALKREIRAQRRACRAGGGRDKRPILLRNVPADFIRIGSGLGHAAPANVNILPALFEDDVTAVIELASFSEFNETHQSFLDQLMESVGIVLNTIAATMRTEGLLEQSQLLTQELQARQTELTTKSEELHATNEELEEKGAASGEREAAGGSPRISRSRWRGAAVEEKAEQLALTSKYKSEFLANMSHELRTPLNSLLILSKLLADNPQGNLNEKQTEFARTIHGAGSDLLSLINDILDLSKIESGTVSIEVGDMPMTTLKQHMERTFRQLAADKNLDFHVEFDTALPATIRTDEKRLQQVVLNLLSNAFKFTSHGSVTLAVRSNHRRVEQEPSGPARGGQRHRDRRDRHRHRHSGRQAEADLRGVPAGRRHDQPQIWRHRAGPLDQPRDRAAAGRRIAGALDAGRGVDVHFVRAAADRRADSGGGDSDGALREFGRAGARRAAGRISVCRRPRRAGTAARWC